MIFTETSLAGAFVLDIAPHTDERGFFARSVCSEEFAKHGLNSSFVQQSVSRNVAAGTLRGLHYQAAPYAEDKLVRATRGAIFDVIVDIRRESPTFGQWYGVELSADNHRQIYIPKGYAHGFQTLQANTEVLYQMTVAFEPAAPRGILWNDPDLAIAWPFCEQRILSPKDLALPLFRSI